METPHNPASKSKIRTRILDNMISKVIGVRNSAKPNTPIPIIKSTTQNPASDTSPKKKVGGKWSRKYKKSIDCKHPKGFSQKQYCKYGRKTQKKSRKLFQ